MGEDGPEYWVVSNVGRERPALPPPFPAHEDNYAKAIIDALKEGFKDANAALDRRDFDSLWSTAGRVVNRLKDASGTFKARTLRKAQIHAQAGDKRRRVYVRSQDLGRGGGGKRGRRR